VGFWWIEKEGMESFYAVLVLVVLRERTRLYKTFDKINEDIDIGH
jgi:hypothetical protein